MTLAKWIEPPPPKHEPCDGLVSFSQARLATRLGMTDLAYRIIWRVGARRIDAMGLAIGGQLMEAMAETTKALAEFSETLFVSEPSLREIMGEA